MKMKNSSDTIGTFFRTQNLPVCITGPQPTVIPRWARVETDKYDNII